MKILWIACAGAAGSLARYGIGVLLLASGRSWPAGTLTVNVAGCFGIGVISALASRIEMSETLRLALTVGFLGGFTTYSSFNEELLSMLRQGSAGTAAAYLLVTVAGGLIAGLAGYLAGSAVAGS